MFCCPPQKCTMAHYFSQPFLKPGRNVFHYSVDGAWSLATLFAAATVSINFHFKLDFKGGHVGMLREDKILAYKCYSAINSAISLQWNQFWWGYKVGVCFQNNFTESPLIIEQSCRVLHKEDWACSFATAVFGWRNILKLGQFQAGV